MTLRVFKCPFCGYKFRDDPERKSKGGATNIMRHITTTAMLLEDRRRSVDLTCPNCEQDFEVEVEG
ncbi:MAG: hypothetical protein ACETWR_02470 [Anaerolineae bacterium]